MDKSVINCNPNSNNEKNAKKEIKQIILFTIDCLRYDCFKSTLNPILQRIMKKEYFWEKMIASGPWTAPSMSSLFTAEFPFTKNKVFVPIPKNLKTFPEILSKNGIITCGIHSNPWLSKKFNFNKGF